MTTCDWCESGHNVTTVESPGSLSLQLCAVCQTISMNGGQYSAKIGSAGFGNKQNSEHADAFMMGPMFGWLIPRLLD